jgi:hypothetical protein
LYLCTDDLYPEFNLWTQFVTNTLIPAFQVKNKDRHSDSQAGRQAGRQTDRQTSRQTLRQSDRRESGRKIVRKTGRQTDRQTDRLKIIFLYDCYTFFVEPFL